MHNALMQASTRDTPPMLSDTASYQNTEEARELVDFGRKVFKHCGLDSPLLAMSRKRLQENVDRFRKAMPSIHPHYAVKANPDEKVLSVLHDAGAGFEIASRQELQSLLKLGVDGADLYYSNPIKTPAFIRAAADAGVRWYVVDSVEEITKIHAIVPDAKLYIRLSVSNKGSNWPLSGKFGVTEEGVMPLLSAAIERNMTVNGVSFHVGSQCTHVENWAEAIRSARRVFGLLEKAGFKPELLNLGGGFPVQMVGNEPTIEEIAESINAEIADLPASIKVVAEPGRYFVASAGCLVTQVVGTATRGQQPWCYLDCGLYSGLMEIVENLPYHFYSDTQGETVNWTIAGPTCDSIDVLVKSYPLPQSVGVGDSIYIPYTGAYCHATGGAFNGFPVPEVVVL